MARQAYSGIVNGKIDLVDNETINPTTGTKALLDLAAGTEVGEVDEQAVNNFLSGATGATDEQKKDVAQKLLRTIDSANGGRGGNMPNYATRAAIVDRLLGEVV